MWFDSVLELQDSQVGSKPRHDHEIDTAIPHQLLPPNPFRGFPAFHSSTLSGYPDRQGKYSGLLYFFAAIPDGFPQLTQNSLKPMLPSVPCSHKPLPQQLRIQTSGKIPPAAVLALVFLALAVAQTTTLVKSSPRLLSSYFRSKRSVVSFSTPHLEASTSTLWASIMPALFPTSASGSSERFGPLGIVDVSMLVGRMFWAS